jgi:hypothetical protein
MGEKMGTILLEVKSATMVVAVQALYPAHFHSHHY